ncbi:MAG: hypothetical protein DRQ08_09335 [Candidatus Latescibacterota bacterium]|nr:MAG: hypothetical protein DRQ08_09335 [Candidatus Latescibacterota bacterium]
MVLDSLFYSKESKIIKFKAKTGEIFRIEVIEEPNRKLKSIRSKVISDIKNLTKKVWGDPRDLAAQWFSLADVLLIARKEGNMKGFATGKYLKDNVVLLLGTVIIPDARNKGLATFMNTFILRLAWKRILKKAKWKVWKWLQPLYLVFRTENPSLYEAISKKIRVVPSIKGLSPSHYEVKIATEVATMLSPNCEFDRDTFVIKKACSAYPELSYPQEKIPWARDKRINEFCERYLRLTEREGNIFVIVGRISVPLFKFMLTK